MMRSRGAAWIRSGSSCAMATTVPGPSTSRWASSRWSRTLKRRSATTRSRKPRRIIASGCAWYSAAGADSPDDVADVVGHQQCATLVDRDPHGPALRLFLRVHEAGEHVERHPRGLALRERHEDHVVAVERLAIPRAVTAHEGAARESRPQLRTLGEREPQRRDMRSERVVGPDGLGHEV